MKKKFIELGTPLIAVCLLLALGSFTSGCAGGGDSAPAKSTTPRCYYVSDFTQITPANVQYVAGIALNGRNQPASVPFDPVGIARHIADQVTTMPVTDGYSTVAGDATVSSQVDGVTGLGNLSITFNQHINAGYTLNGTVDVNIQSVDQSLMSNDKTITLSSFTVADAYGSVTINGIIREVNTISGTDNDPSSDLTLNFSATDVAGHEIEMMDYTYKTTYNGFDGLLYSETYGGNFYDSVHGCAQVQNFAFSSNTLIIVSLNPQVSRHDTVRTGVMNLNSDGRARVNLATNALTTVEVDTTGDGLFDYSLTTTWNAL